LLRAVFDIPVTISQNPGNTQYIVHNLGFQNAAPCADLRDPSLIVIALDPAELSRKVVQAAGPNE
jgi:hypothetical protein